MPETYTQLIESPVGPLLIMAEGDALTSLSWAQKLGLGFMETPNEVTEHAAQVLKAYFTQNKPISGLQFKFAGTDFQNKVWQALTEIPYAKTVTYQDIANQLNSAPRAVGGAVGANPLPIVVPCHRVVGANGQMVGFSGYGGIETKKTLLALEQH